MTLAPDIQMASMKPLFIRIGGDGLVEGAVQIPRTSLK